MIEINVAKSAGFCLGVKRALNIAFKAARSGTKIEMLGDIVHNEEVVKEINEMGIKKVSQLASGKNKTLLIRAHGVSLKTFTQAEKLGYHILDATCPMVKEIHTIAKENEQHGYRIIIIGDKNHDEVKGIIGQLKEKAILIDDLANIDLEEIKNIEKAALVVQSTQDEEKTISIVEALKPHIPELKFFNTICRPTKTKQTEIKEMAVKNDVVIIIGSKTSANTKRLYEITSSINKRTYWIQSRKDLKPDWFKNARSVGVTAGASTPDYTTKDIIQNILGIA